MNQTKQFLQIIQTQKNESEQTNKFNFSADQEKAVRDLIGELKWHLSKFSDDSSNEVLNAMKDNDEIKKEVLELSQLKNAVIKKTMAPAVIET